MSCRDPLSVPLSSFSCVVSGPCCSCAQRIVRALCARQAIAAALREAGRVEEAERVEKRIKMTRVEHAETIKHILGPSPAPAPKMDIDKRVVQRPRSTHPCDFATGTAR